MKGEHSVQSCKKEGFWLRVCGFRPPLAFSCLGAVGFSAASLVCVGAPELWNPPPAAEYGVYALAAVFLALAVWALALALRRGWPFGAAFAAAHRSRLLARLWDDAGFRARCAGWGSLAGSALLALSKMAEGWLFSSRWFAVLAGYYLLLCLAKGLVLYSGRAAAAQPDQRLREKREWQGCRLCGWLLAALAFPLQAMAVLIVREGSGFRYQGYLIFAVALYDFCCLIASLAFFAVNRGRHSPAALARKGIGLASSLVSMLSLQTAMFASFGSDLELQWQRRMNLATGTAVCALLVLLGLGMAARAGRRLRAL